MENKPSYEELYKWYEAEKRIKNHLYYYIMFKGLLNGYYTYFQAYANEIEEKEKRDGQMFRALLLIDGMESCRNTVHKKQCIKVDYEIIPN